MVRIDLQSRQGRMLSWPLDQTKMRSTFDDGAFRFTGIANNDVELNAWIGGVERRESSR
jgi:hypothetical protein